MTQTVVNRAEPTINDAQAEHYALAVLGDQFTRNWIEVQKDRRLDGFITSAEYCRSEMRAYCIKIAIISLPSVAFLGLMIYSIIANSLFGICISGVPALISVVLAWRKAKKDWPGDTIAGIGSDWNLWRKVAIEIGLVTTLANQIRWEYEYFKGKLSSTSKRYGHFREIISSLRSNLLTVYSQETLSAERKGLGEKRKLNRDLFAKTDRLGVRLGFESANWKKYLPKYIPVCND